MATLPSWPDLAQGNTGKNVSALQSLLNYRNGNTALTVDGSFGPAVHSAVVAYQRSKGLTANGIAGANTLSSLRATVQNGTANNAVRAAQHLLSKFESLTIDGSFGPGTVTAVRAFQQKMAITVDGSIGPTTWQYLFGYASYPGGGSTGSAKTLAMPSGKNCNWNQKHSGVTKFFGASACTLITGLNVGNFYATTSAGYTPTNMNSSTYWTSAGYTWAVPGPGQIGGKVCEGSSKATCLARIKTEIDAGRPVVVNIGSITANHTVFAYGYNNSAKDFSNILVHDPANMTTSSVNGRVTDLQNAMNYSSRQGIWSLRLTSRG